jgi:hypothetical protein
MNGSAIKRGGEGRLASSFGCAGGGCKIDRGTHSVNGQRHSIARPSRERVRWEG